MTKNIIVSHSLLNSLNINPKWVQKRLEDPLAREPQGTMARIGSVVDCLLTQPEKWGDLFQVIEVNKPYGLMGKFVDNLPKGLTPYSDVTYFEDAYKESGYKLKIEKVISNFWASASAVKYYQFIHSNDTNKTIITMDEYDTALRMKSSILDNPYTKIYFDGSMQVEYQVRVKFNYMGHSCKAFLDGIVIDDLNKTITPFDLKTTSKYGDFSNIYLDSGYFRQAAFYMLALKHFIKSTPWLEGFTINPFRFIVATINSNYILPAAVYEVSGSDINAGIQGGIVNNKYYKGINNLIDDLNWHLETNYWDSSRELWVSRGVEYLNIFPNSEVDDK